MSTTPAAKGPKTQIFVARQPILDKSGRIFGYELLYRHGANAEDRMGVHEDYATAKVIDEITALDKMVNKPDPRTKVFEFAFFSGDPKGVPPIEPGDDRFAVCLNRHRPRRRDRNPTSLLVNPSALNEVSSVPFVR